jgi:lysophospholipase
MKREDIKKEEMMVVSGDGTRLRFRKDVVEDPRALIVIAHGLCEHLNRYDYFTEKLNENGYSVYRYDQRGHGKSEGKKVYFSDYNEMPEDLAAIVAIAKGESNGKKVFLFGHSMGGETVTLYGTKYPGTVDGIITSGALTHYNHPVMGDTFPIEAPEDTYVPNELGDGVCSDIGVIEAYANDPLVEKQISTGLINQIYAGVQWLKEHKNNFSDPVLILHGADDGLVSAKDSLDFYEGIGSKDKSLRVYANLYHEILNEPSKNEIIADILLWLGKHKG